VNIIFDNSKSTRRINIYITLITNTMAELWTLDKI